MSAPCIRAPTPPFSISGITDDRYQRFPQVGCGGQRVLRARAALGGVVVDRQSAGLLGDVVSPKPLLVGGADLAVLELNERAAALMRCLASAG